jgi:hypothetical protein
MEWESELLQNSEHMCCKLKRHIGKLAACWFPAWLTLPPCPEKGYVLLRNVKLSRNYAAIRLCSSYSPQSDRQFILYLHWIQTALAQVCQFPYRHKKKLQFEDYSVSYPDMFNCERHKPDLQPARLGLECNKCMLIVLMLVNTPIHVYIKYGSLQATLCVWNAPAAFTASTVK